jgi:hypothetical protein
MSIAIPEFPRTNIKKKNDLNQKFDLLHGQQLCPLHQFTEMTTICHVAAPVFKGFTIMYVYT